MSLPRPPTLPRCYRHPDREAGRSCTRCGKPACSDCLRQATVGSHCLDCAKAARPDIKSRAQIWNARQITPVTSALIAINILVFAWLTIHDGLGIGFDSTGQTHQDLAVSAYELKLNHEWYRLITAGFVHYGVIHIVLNMFALYQLGQLIERAMSRVQFTLLYFAALLGGSLGALLMQGLFDLSAGASGAIFGLLGAAAVGLHRRGVNVFSTGIGGALVLNLILTFGIRGISIGGHLGGLVAGAVCGYVMLAPHWHKIPKWTVYAVPVVVSVACVVASVIYVRSLTPDDFVREIQNGLGVSGLLR